MRQFSTGRAHMNFLTEDERGNRIVAAYSTAKYGRLVAAKIK